jgi:hypothetical protein
VRVREREGGREGRRERERETENPDVCDICSALATPGPPGALPPTPPGDVISAAAAADWVCVCACVCVRVRACARAFARRPKCAVQSGAEQREWLDQEVPGHGISRAGDEIGDVIRGRRARHLGSPAGWMRTRPARGPATRAAAGHRPQLRGPQRRPAMAQ